MPHPQVPSRLGRMDRSTGDVWSGLARGSCGECARNQDKLGEALDVRVMGSERGKTRRKSRGKIVLERCRDGMMERGDYIN